MDFSNTLQLKLSFYFLWWTPYSHVNLCPLCFYGHIFTCLWFCFLVCIQLKPCSLVHSSVSQIWFLSYTVKVSHQHCLTWISGHQLLTWFLFVSLEHAKIEDVYICFLWNIFVYYERLEKIKNAIALVFFC